MDIVDQSTRSRMMSRIGGRDTRPERIVRSLLHAKGFRYRLHKRDLPGSPDIVLSKHRIAIFVHGCFWHVHDGCKLAPRPKSNLHFWEPKLAGNKERDLRQQFILHSLGWRILVVWECATRNVALWPALQVVMDKWIMSSEEFGEISDLSLANGGDDPAK